MEFSIEFPVVEPGNKNVAARHTLNSIHRRCFQGELQSVLKLKNVNRRTLAHFQRKVRGQYCLTTMVCRSFYNQV